MTKSECESELVKEIKIREDNVERSSNTKLLGVTIDDRHNWKEHFAGTNGLINALNKRTFSIRRVRNQLPKSDVLKVVHSIWMSKLRFGLQLCYKVRTKKEDPEMLRA